MLVKELKNLLEKMSDTVEVFVQTELEDDVCFDFGNMYECGIPVEVADIYYSEGNHFFGEPYLVLKSEMRGVNYYED